MNGKILVLVICCGLLVSCSPQSTAVNNLPEGIVDTGGSATDKMDEFGPIIAKYGKPERDDSTENDVPRPPIVTRFVEYRPEDVKIAFVPLGKLGDSPPFSGWKVIGYIDIGTDTKISRSEAFERLSSRLR
jgi:hypothetical protein